MKTAAVILVCLVVSPFVLYLAAKLVTYGVLTARKRFHEETGEKE